MRSYPPPLASRKTSSIKLQLEKGAMGARSNRAPTNTPQYSGTRMSPCHSHGCANKPSTVQAPHKDAGIVPGVTTALGNVYPAKVNWLFAAAGQLLSASFQLSLIQTVQLQYGPAKLIC